MNPVKSFITYFSPALLVGALALFFFEGSVPAQRLNDLPPPPPSPKYKPKPTPTPTPPVEDVLDVVRITSNLVVVPVSVVDARGEPVRGLQAGDFRLEEARQPQQIAEIGNPEEVPLEIALLIDVSGSTNARFVFEKQAAANFLKQVLKSAERATLYMIDRTPVLKLTNASAGAATTGLLSIDPAIDKGPTAFFDTVVEAAQYLAEKTPAQHRRVMLVISDGVDNYSEKIKKAIGATRAEQEAVGVEARQKIYDRAVLEVQRDVQRADAVFYSINPAGETMHLNVITRRGQDGMRQLAEATGGNAFVPQKAEDLEAVFRQIAAELRGQYLLQYYSNSQLPGGQFRTISVTIPSRAAVRVRARQGYYPKKK
ncbi:MAG TPA: VWA domain-containing protein [Pyrinomonadaceae bacterium]|nr:VWA domain-containing protein [Pyrinomonadaceae bacterium]